MSKILVSVNESGFLSALTEIKAITDNAKMFNIQIQEYLGHPISQEIFNDVLNKGQGTKEFYRLKMDKDIARLKILSPKIKRQMMDGIDDFEILVNEFYESLRKSNRYTSYITIEKGKAILTEQSKEQLHETFKNYADTPERIAVYEAQKEACTALNKLYTMVKAASDINFILPVHFYGSFFDMKDNIITAKPVQFSVLNKK